MIVPASCEMKNFRHYCIDKKNSIYSQPISWTLLRRRTYNPKEQFDLSEAHPKVDDTVED